jgi:hypothetical protein
MSSELKSRNKRPTIELAAWLLVAVSLPCVGQTSQSGWDQWHTGNQANGRFWNDMATIENASGSTEKSTYLMGFADALTLPEAKNVFPYGLRTEEIVKALDRFFDTPENLRITIANALVVCHERLAGMAEPDLQKLILKMRALSAPPTNAR